MLLRYGRSAPDSGQALDASLSPNEVLGPPRAVRHFTTLLWWALIAALGLGTYLAWQRSLPPPLAPPAAPLRSEHEAFLAVLLGKVEAADDRALQPELLQRQLRALQAAGAHALTLQQLDDFEHRSASLPSQPVLITFEDARRRTLETVDPILARLNWSAVAFVDVGAVSEGSVDLVSRRQLRAMAASGRWEFALKGCDASGASQLAQWTGMPVLAHSCLDSAGAPPPTPLPLRFVNQDPGANYAGDVPRNLKLIRDPAAAALPDTLAHALTTWMPRRATVSDEFAGPALGAGWIADPAHARVTSGHLELYAAARDPGATLAPGGAQRWRDARVEVELPAAPRGEFWIYARRAGPQAFVRLGIAGDAVLLQSADGGTARQLGRAALPPPPIVLSLSVIGGRAVALVNGAMLTSRPAGVADTRGDFALAAWSGDTDAAATLERAEFAPLQRRAALVDAAPGAEALALLRAQSAQLWAASPRLYRWDVAAAPSAAPLPRVLDMLVHHERFALLPAVTIDALPAPADAGRFADQLLRWAQAPGVEGLNLVIAHPAPGDEQRLRPLRLRFERAGKVLLQTPA